MKVDIENKIDKIIALNSDGTVLSKADAFTIFSLLTLVLEKDNYTRSDIEQITVENFTNGTRDGGIDAAYLDSETQVLAIMQTKYSKGIGVNEAVEEIKKIITTLQRFQELDTVDYSKDMRKKLRELLDSVSDTDEIQYKIIFVTRSKFDQDKVLRLIKHDLQKSELEIEVEFVDEKNLEEKLVQLKNRVDRVQECSINIEKANQYVEYRSEEMRGAFTNVWASSVYRMYEKYSENGLFNLNVRKYIARKSIDDGIIRTVRNDSKDFWFLNNGLTIGAGDYNFDGNVLKLYDFSIVNGAQTTSLIGKNFNKDHDFLIPVKIIAPDEYTKFGPEDLEDFFTQIAESTNSQKPISPRDLKANAREMRTLRNWLKDDYNVDFRVKQGVKVDNKAKYIIWNDQFAKIMQSFVYQRPGSARSNAKALFENKDIYKSIFISNGFELSPDKKQFVYDLVDLNDMYDRITTSDQYSKSEKSFLKQAKMSMFAIFGLIYRYKNKLVGTSEIRKIKQDNGENLQMKGFISEYKDDDLDANLQNIINDYFVELQESYNELYENDEVSSISNYFKLDSTYKRKSMIMAEKNFRKIETRPNILPEYCIFKF